MVTTVEDSALRTEMENLESDDEDTSRGVLWYKTMSCLRQIRPHHRDESWSCKKFVIDALVDHVTTCTTHSGAKKSHDWVVDQIGDLFRTTHKVKIQQVVRSSDTYITQ